MMAGLEPVWRRVLGRAGWSVGGGIALAVVGVISTILQARWLSPADMGLFLTVTSVVLLGSPLVQLGLGETAIRDIAAARAVGRSDQVRRMTRDILGLGFLGALLGAILVAAGVAWFPGGSAVWLPAAGWLVFASLYGLSTDIGRGLQDERAMAFPGHILANLLFLGAVGLALLSGMPGAVQTAVWMRLAAALVSAAVIVRELRIRLREAAFEATSDGTKAMPPSVGTWLSRSWPVLSHKLIQGTLSQCDVLILSVLRPLDEVAVYGVASRLVSMVAFPLYSINVAMGPTVAELHAQGRRERLERTVRKAAAVSGLPALAGLAALALGGSWVLTRMYGPAYAGGASIILILGIGRLAFVLAGSSGLTLMMTGHQRTLMAVSLVAAVVIIGLGVWWGHLYGGPGLAAAVSTGECMRFAWLLGAVRQRLGIWTHVPLSPRWWRRKQ